MEDFGRRSDAAVTAQRGLMGGCDDDVAWRRFGLGCAWRGVLTSVDLAISLSTRGFAAGHSHVPLDTTMETKWARPGRLPP